MAHILADTLGFSELINAQLDFFTWWVWDPILKSA